MDVQAAGSLFAVVAPNPDMEKDTLPETVVKHNKITQCNVVQCLLDIIRKYTKMYTEGKSCNAFILLVIECLATKMCIKEACHGISHDNISHWRWYMYKHIILPVS